jgi:hypothetical protein
MPTNSKLENQKPIYPIAGIQYRYPENRAVIGLQYIGNSIVLTMGYRIGKNHNE